MKLLALAEDPDALVERAEQARLGYREFLDLLLEEEVGVLEGRRYAARLKLSALPHRKTLADFDLAFQPELDPKTIAELRSLRFLERRVSVLLLGLPGLGRHISPWDWRWRRSRPATSSATRHSTSSCARRADQLERLREKLSHFQRPHLLVVDEVGYLSFETGRMPTASSSSSTAVTSAVRCRHPKKRVSEWAELFGDEVLTAAILDRHLHEAEVVTISGPSPRLRGRMDALEGGDAEAETSA